MTARKYSDDRLHLESLTALVSDPTRAGSDAMTLRRAVEFGLQRASPWVHVDAIGFGEPRWIHRGWARRATIRLIDAEHPTESTEISVEIPWLTDEHAAASATQAPVGGHVGTFWGRERFPVGAYVYAPGVHYIVRQGWEDPDAAVVVDEPEPIEGSDLPDPVVREDRVYRALLAPAFGTAWWLGYGRGKHRVQAHSESLVELLASLRALPLDADAAQLFGTIDSFLLEILWPENIRVSRELRDLALSTDGAQATDAEIERKVREQEARLRALRDALEVDPVWLREDPGAVESLATDPVMRAKARELLAATDFPPIMTRVDEVIELRGRNVTLPEESRAFDRRRLLEGDAEELGRLAQFTADPILHAGGGRWDEAELVEILSTLTQLAEDDSRLRLDGRPLEDGPARAGADEPGSPRLTSLLDPRNWIATGLGEQCAVAVADAVATKIRRMSRSSALGAPLTLAEIQARLTAEHAKRQRQRMAQAAKRGEAPPAEEPAPTATEDRRIDIFAALIRGAIQRALVDVANGRGDYANSSVIERPINTLGRVEVARQRTFLGPHGLETYEGRLDLRVQPAGWRSILCPLQTPESEKIGFIRHLALEQWGDDPLAQGFRDADGDRDLAWGDLSLAASLVPYVSHDDPTRIAIGAKMFKQAVLLDEPEVPVVRTGAERLVGEAGVLRALNSGRVSLDQLDRGVITVGSVRHAFGPAPSPTARQDDRWRLADGIVDGQPVAKGTILAVAPDVIIEAGEPQFAYGRNARVAFMAWDGWNYEDGVIVSESFAAKMSSTHTVQLKAEYDFTTQGEFPSPLLAPDQIDDVHAPGTPVLRIASFDPQAPARVLSFPEQFRVVRVTDPRRAQRDLRQRERESSSDEYISRELGDDGKWVASVRFEVRRPLQIGDKLTTRHGGKGVVTRILPDAEMPVLADDLPVEVVLNPLGVLRRLNIGALIEVHEGLAHAIDGSDARGSVRAARRIGTSGRQALAARLASLGAPGGRQRLRRRAPDGAFVGFGPPEGVLAGPLYLVKLDHLARNKSGARDDGAASPLTFQPLRNSGWKADQKLAAPQRLGEMEMWAFDAIGARWLIDDLFDDRGVGEPGQRNLPTKRRLLPAGFRAALAHLAVAGVSIDAIDSSGEARNLLTNPTIGQPGERLRVSRHDGGQLRDLIREFEDVHGAIGSPSPAIAHLMLEWALSEMRSRSSDEIPLLGQQSVSFAIPLPHPVQHPWESDGVFGSVRLPDVRFLPLLPAALLDNPYAAEWGGIRQRYEWILKLVLDLRAQLARQDAAEPSGVVVLLTDQVTTAVQRFLGRITDGPKQDTVAGRLSQKYGLLRRNMLGAASVRSGRAVLVGDPTLPPESVKIPDWMADRIGVPTEPTSGFADVVIINRQPTLHPYNLVALRAQRWSEHSVAINPILLSMIAGDFDGDTVAVHRPDDERAREEAWRLRRPSAALRSGASGNLLAKLDVDVALGQALRALEPGAASESPDEIATAGSDPTRTLNALVKYAREGFAAANAWSPSVIEDDAQASLATGVKSGAVKKGDLPLLFERRGGVVLPAPELPGGDVSASYRDGLVSADYFLAAQQGVAGIAAKKLVTPFAGSLTRYLVRRGYETVITSLDTCGAPDGHTPIDCVGEGICAVAYGRDLATGEPVALGARVGIQAALFIGERGTQKALKSIHLRGQNGLMGTIAELARLLGAAAGGIAIADVPAAKRTSSDARKKPQPTFVDVLNWSWKTSRSLTPARDRLRERFLTLLSDDPTKNVEVDPVHLEVLLQPIWRELQEALTGSEKLKRDDVIGALSVRPSSAISWAAWYGDLDPIVRRLGHRDVEAIEHIPLERVFLSTLRNSAEAG